MGENISPAICALSIAGLMAEHKLASYRGRMDEQTAHRRNITEADLAAKDRLARIWARKARALGVTEQTVADLLDRSQGLVNQYRNGRLALNYKAVLAFAQALEVSPTDIRNDLPEQQLGAPQMPVHEDWTDVVAYEQSVAAGDGTYRDDYPETNGLKFTRSSLRRKGLFPSNLSVFYASGDSMEPRIHDGDALLFDTSDTTPRDGAIFVLTYDHNYYVKRLHKYGDQWFMVSENSADPKWKRPTPVTFGEGCEIVGRVRWIGSWED